MTIGDSIETSTVLDTSTYRVYWTSSHALTVEIKNGVTDADPSRRPTMRGRDPDERGNVNYYVDANQRKRATWKKAVARFLRQELILPELAVRDPSMEPRLVAASITLSDFPGEYKLYEHRSRRDRKDYYLYGSTLVERFRSPAEFILHLKWLLLEGHPTGEPKLDCECRWCSGGRQTNINNAHGFSGINSRAR